MTPTWALLGFATGLSLCLLYFSFFRDEKEALFNIKEVFSNEEEAEKKVATAKQEARDILAASETADQNRGEKKKTKIYSAHVKYLREEIRKAREDSRGHEKLAGRLKKLLGTVQKVNG